MLPICLFEQHSWLPGIANTTVVNGGNDMEAKKITEVAVPTTKEDLRELIRRAEKGDRATLPAIRKLLEDPVYVKMFNGNLSRCVEESFAKGLSDNNLAVQEAICAKLKAIRTELLGAEPTPIERLLVERVALCWLQVQDAELRYVSSQKDMTFRQGEFHQKRMDAANRRFLSAVKSLALVRRLAIPALQINLARKQVNVVASAGTGAEPASA